MQKKVMTLLFMSLVLGGCNGSNTSDIETQNNQTQSDSESVAVDKYSAVFKKYTPKVGDSVLFKKTNLQEEINADDIGHQGDRWMYDISGQYSLNCRYNTTYQRFEIVDLSDEYIVTANFSNSKGLSKDESDEQCPKSFHEVEISSRDREELEKLESYIINLDWKERCESENLNCTIDEKSQTLVAEMDHFNTADEVTVDGVVHYNLRTLKISGELEAKADYYDNSKLNTKVDIVSAQEDMTLSSGYLREAVEDYLNAYRDFEHDIVGKRISAHYDDEEVRGRELNKFSDRLQYVEQIKKNENCVARVAYPLTSHNFSIRLPGFDRDLNELRPGGSIHFLSSYNEVRFGHSSFDRTEECEDFLDEQKVKLEEERRINPRSRKKLIWLEVELSDQNELNFEYNGIQLR